MPMVTCVYLVTCSVQDIINQTRTVRNGTASDQYSDPVYGLMLQDLRLCRCALVLLASHLNCARQLTC